MTKDILIFATNNQNKVAEIRFALQNRFEILTLKTDSLKMVIRKLPFVVVPEISEPDRVKVTSAPRL